jgi:hypothetical protein
VDWAFRHQLFTVGIKDVRSRCSDRKYCASGIGADEFPVTDRAVKPSPRNALRGRRKQPPDGVTHSAHDGHPLSVRPDLDVRNSVGLET